MIFTFKNSRTVFSRYFAFDFFKAKLTDISVFLGWNRVTGASIVGCTFPIVFGSVMVGYYDTDKAQTFISAIDAIIVSFFMLIFMIWET